MDTAVEFMRKEQQKKLENFRELNKTAQKGHILFTGSSLMEMFPVTDFLTEDGSEQIKERLPDTKVFVMAFYPVCTKGRENEPVFINRNNKNLLTANEAVWKLSEKMGYWYIDVNNGLTDGNGMLKENITIDGIHMHPDGYRIVWNNLKSYLYALR